MKAIPRLQIEANDHVIFGVDAAILLSNVLNVAIQGCHRPASRRGISGVAATWRKLLFSKDVSTLLATNLDNLGRANLPKELSDPVQGFTALIEGPPAEEQDWAVNTLQRLSAQLIADNKPPVAMVWVPALAYPRPYMHVNASSLYLSTDVQNTWRLPHMKSDFCDSIASILLEIDDIRIGNDLIVAVGEVVKATRLTPGDRPFSDALRIAIQLHAILATFALYQAQGTLFYAHLHAPYMRLLLTQAMRVYPDSIGRLSKLRDSFERVLTYPLHPLLSFAAKTLSNAKTMTPAGERSLIVTAAKVETLESVTSTLLDLFVADHAKSALYSKPNAWLLDDSSPKDDEAAYTYLDIERALLNSRCASLFETARKAVGWVDAPTPQVQLALDRRDFALCDGTHISKHPAAVLLGLIPNLSMSSQKPFVLSGRAEYFFDTSWDDEGAELRPRPYKALGYGTVTAETEEPTEVAVSALPLPAKVESDWNPAYHEATYLPESALMGPEADRVVRVAVEPSAIIDPTVKEIYTWFIRQSEVYPLSGVSFETLTGFVNAKPKTKRLTDGTYVFWDTCWEPQLYRPLLSLDELRVALNYDIPKGATPLKPVTASDPGVRALCDAILLEGLNGTAAKHLSIVRTTSADFTWRAAVLRADQGNFAVIADDFTTSKIETPWACVMYDNDINLEHSLDALKPFLDLMSHVQRISRTKGLAVGGG